MPAFSIADDDNVPSDAKDANSKSRTDKPAKSLDDKLLKDLLGDTNAADDADDPLERAVTSMRDVGERISKRDTGDETRELQEQIVKDLEKLIEQARQRKPSQQQPSPSPQQQQPQPNGQEPSKDSSPQDAQPQGGQPKDSKQPQESVERNDKGESKEAQLARREMLVKDVWGHLPPQLREQLLNIYSEKALPKYEDLVRRYYEALADSARKEGRK